MTPRYRGKHPMQPVQWDGQGVIRFKENGIVRFLVDWARERGMSLNELSMMRFSDEDWTQLAQLIGYSVSGAGDLSYFDRKVLKAADTAAEQLIAKRRRRR